MYFPQDEYEERWSRVRDSIRAKGFDSALIWGQGGGNYERCNDILYLVNYFSNQSAHVYDTRSRVASSYSALLVTGADEPHLFADQLDYPSDLLATRNVSSHRDLIQGVISGLRSARIRGPLLTVGEDFLPVKYHARVTTAIPEIEFAYDDELVRDLRRFKSPRELDAIRVAGENVSAALQALMEAAMRPGITQSAVAAAGMAELARRGGFPHMVPVSSGKHIDRFTGDPIAGFSRDIVLSPGEPVRAWVYGPAWQGYWLDPGRTGMVGRSGTAEYRRLIQATIDVTHKIMEAIQPGVAVIDVLRLADKLRRETGSGDDPVSNMFPVWGHGVGLFWERPHLGEGLLGEEGTEDRYAAFFEGQSFTAEMFLSWPGVGSAGIEECFIVHKGKNELLTTTDLDWW